MLKNKKTKTCKKMREENKNISKEPVSGGVRGDGSNKNNLVRNITIAVIVIIVSLIIIGICI